jgi:hypothetical protein
MATMAERVREFLDDMSVDVVEERVVEYVIREVRNGRKLAEVLNDPYVKNRFDPDKVARVLGNPEVSSAIEEQISTAFQKREFGFHD